jgi:hypothetical protein
VIVNVMETRLPDVYTRAGAAERVADYYLRVGSDPS